VTDDDNVVEETADMGNALLAQFVGETLGLFRNFSHGDGYEGDHLPVGGDATMDDITTEPDADGYNRIPLQKSVQPTFGVDGYVGVLDHLFIVNDDGELLAALPLDEPIAPHDHQTEVTLDVWGDDSED